jgi:hypothetical protein
LIKIKRLEGQMKKASQDMEKNGPQVEKGLPLEV